MNRRRKTWITGLALGLAAVLIWLRDPRWTTAPADTLPLMLGLPLAYQLGRPWLPAIHPLPEFRIVSAIIGAATLGCGWINGSLTMLAIGWTSLAVLWAGWSFTRSPRRLRLAWLLLLSFPWLVLDWQSIGWAFRLSSAEVAETVFALLQMPALREGTHLSVMGVPIEIEASCAGWNLLQLVLLSGVALGTHEIRSTRRFALLLCLLPAVAWLANLLRILILSGIALTFDTQVAGGAIHGITGLVVLGAVLALTKGLCLLLDPPLAFSSRIVKAT